MRVRNDSVVYKTKEAILMQLSRFDIVIDVEGFFQINRSYLATVSCVNEK